MTPGQLVRLRRPLRARDLRKLSPMPWWVELQPEPMRVRAVWGRHVDLERVLSKRQLQAGEELVLMHALADDVERIR